MNNKHQELIAEKVAEFLRMVDLDRDKGGWHIPYEGVWTGDQKSWLIQTLQDTIDTVLKEERGRIKIDSNDMQKVGDHYWGGDYEPTYYELEKLTESMNEILQTKLKPLDKTPPNTV